MENALSSDCLAPGDSRPTGLRVLRPRCGRTNPAAALYCHHDGLALASDAAPIDAGSQPFLTPFVFPSGRSCRTFDELAIAVEDVWDEAIELLREGIFGVFLGGIGRADLARVAAQARKALDPDRGLDEFLNRLPVATREPPMLHVLPTEINLGRVSRNETRQITLRLVNEGMGLLHGSAVSEESPWLMIGEPPGFPDKLFACRREMVLPVQVIGERMRAGNKPLLGRVVVESSGGNFALVVRAEVPAEPFPEGALAGALTPRQLAEKARAAPMESFPLFERGLVKSWYETNGWSYPIQGPQAAGLGGLQQFFEALGLTVPPRVAISETSVSLRGKPGERLTHSLKVTTADNRPVYAHAVSDVPWLQVLGVSGTRKARIKLLVPSVPAMPGESLLGRVLVHSNGAQQFTVAVSLKIDGIAGPRLAPEVEVIQGLPLLEVEELLTLDPAEVIELSSDEVTPDSSDSLPVLTIEADRTPSPARPEENDPTPTARSARHAPFWPHLIAPGILLVIVLSAILHDVLLPDRPRRPGTPPPVGVPAPPASHERLHSLSGRKTRPGDDYALVIQVRNPQPGESLTLTVPEGLTLIRGDRRQMPIPPATPPGNYSRVVWHLRGVKEGEYPLRIESTRGESVTFQLSVGPFPLEG